MDLRKYPYDKQKFTAYFKVLGFSADEVVLRADPEHTSDFHRNIHIPQWYFTDMVAEDREIQVPDGTDFLAASTFSFTVHVRRNRWYIVRLLVIPLAIVVVLSWSVFWMDSSSLGDRMGVSFVGILAAVAYQIVIGDILPKIAHYTPIHAFINVSFLLMCLTVVINLRVGILDRAGKAQLGNRLDRRSRWAFPLVYLGSLSAIILNALG